MLVRLHYLDALAPKAIYDRATAIQECNAAVVSCDAVIFQSGAVFCRGDAACRNARGAMLYVQC
eukprot:405055-Rhodomonas_salina.1